MSFKLSKYSKNSTNPFLEDAIEKIQGNVAKKYKNASNTGEKAILKAIDHNGELLGHTTFVRQIEVDEEQFTKIYLSQFSHFWGLGKQAIKVFGYVMTKLQPKQDMFMFIMSEAMEHSGYKGESSIFIGLGDLVENKIIARGPTDSIYYINPMVAFNGSRVTFAKTYVKKRMKNKGIDPNQTSLMGLLDQERPELKENQEFNEKA
ncbi:MAG: RepA protein [Bacteroidia bacterium]|nr:RepA protein [Bacteroidia bacterium]